MSEVRTILERGVGGATPPPDGFERMLRRRDRKRRNKRIVAGVVGIAVFVAAVWIVTSAGSLDRSERSVVPAVTGAMETGPTVTEPTYTLGPVTPKDIDFGESFMEVWADGDGEAAAAMFSPKGTFDGFEPAILPALHDWFRAEGWTFRAGDCGIHGYGPRAGVVGCGLTYENDLTRALGLPPMETTLSFNIDAGGIEAGWYGAGGDLNLDIFAGYRGHPTNDVLGPVWDTFIDWIANQHPDDFVRMYDADRDYPILDATSNQLWQRYTDEFVASPPGQELARSMSGWDGYGIPPEGTVLSTPEKGDEIARFNPLGSGWVIVYADGRVLWGDGRVNEQRLSREGIDLVRSGAVEPSAFLFGGSAGLPTAAWADPHARLYAAPRFAICPDDVNLLPAQAQALLRGT